MFAGCTVSFINEYIYVENNHDRFCCNFGASTNLNFRSTLTLNASFVFCDFNEFSGHLIFNLILALPALISKIVICIVGQFRINVIVHLH